MPERAIYAIGDLHLPGADDKSMDVFGSHWEGHFDKIAQDWASRVNDRDIVLIPGDISWAMQFAQAQPDLEAIAALPGRKVLIRGNHDFWWSGISKLRAWLPDGMYAIQNDAVSLDGVLFAGSRGWVLPSAASGAEDGKVYAREQLRLQLSLEQARRLGPKGRVIGLIHYPPMEQDGKSTELTDLFTRYQVEDVVYGHLHGAVAAYAFRGTLDGVRYHPVSCDALDFRLYRLPESQVAPEP